MRKVSKEEAITRHIEQADKVRLLDIEGREDIPRGTIAAVEMISDDAVLWLVRRLDNGEVLEISAKTDDFEEI